MLTVLVNLTRLTFPECPYPRALPYRINRESDMKQLEVNKEVLEKLINEDLAEVATNASVCNGSFAIGEFAGCQVQVFITKEEDKFFDTHFGVLTVKPEEKETTCGKCKHLAFGDMMGLKSAYCSFGRDDGDGPIVPHHSEIVDNKRGNPSLITLWRVPEWCQRPGSEVIKSEKQAKKSEWITLTV